MLDVERETKTCYKCREVKDLEEFHRNRRSKDGKMSCCKPCNQEKAKQWSLRNSVPEYRRSISKICSLDGCGKQAASYAAGSLCTMHEQRLRRTGVVGGPDKLELKKENNPNWTGDQVKYDTLHKRLQNWRGRASAYCCVDCGGPASDWSYNHNGEVELWERLMLPRGRLMYVPYSTNTDDYDPRCRRCHIQFDTSRT